MTGRDVLILGTTREDSADEAARVIPCGAINRRYPYSRILGIAPQHRVYLESLGNLRALRGLQYDYLRLTPAAEEVITAEQLAFAFVGRRPR